MEFIPALPPGTRTNIIHRFEITNAHAVKLSPQNKGTWLLDVETIEERGLAVNFDETFDLNTLVPELIDEIENHGTGPGDDESNQIG